MRKLLIMSAAVLALALPTTASAVSSPKWLKYPTCTASTTDLTCTGKAKGVEPPFIEQYGIVEVAIHAAINFLQRRSTLYLGV